LLMIPVICFAYYLPSLDLTSPKMFLSYILFSVLTVVFLIQQAVFPSGKLSHWKEPMTLALAASGYILVYWIWYILTRDVFVQRELIRILPGVTIAIICWQSGISELQQRIFHRIFAITTVIVALGGIAQILGLDPVSWKYSFKEGVFSTMGHPNILAPTLIIGIASLWVSGKNASKKSVQFIWWSLIPILIICLIVTFSKGAWAGFIISLILTITIFSPSKTRSRILIISLVVILIIPAVVLVNGNSFHRILSDNTLRPAIWKSSLNILDTPTHWVAGRGPGSWFIHFPSARNRMFLHMFRRTENIHHAHNEYIEQLTETGLVGAGLFLLIFYLYFKIVLKRSRKQLLLPAEKASFFAILAMLIHGFVSINLRTFSLWTLFWLCAAFALITNKSDKISESFIKKTQVIHLAKWITLCFVTASFCLSYSGISHSAGAMRSVADLYQGRIRMDKPDKTEAINFMKTAIEHDPCNLDAEYDLAVTLYDAGLFSESEEHFSNIRKIAPDFQRIHLNQAILYLQWGKQTENAEILQNARREIIRELELNNLDENYYILGTIEFSMGNIPESKTAFREFINRMDQNRAEMKKLQGFRQSDAIELVKPKNWDMLLKMETIARSRI